MELQNINNSMDFSDLESLSDLQDNGVEERETFPCTACSGTGHWVGGYVRRVEGKCHACNGRGFFYTSPEQRLRARQKAAQKRHARRQEIAEMAVEYHTEHKDLVAYFEDTKNWNSFSLSMLEAIAKYGSLTEGQERAAYNGYAKHQERQKVRAQEQAKRDADRPVIDLTRINKMFEAAKESGLKRPKLRVGQMEIYPAPMGGRNAGFLYVKNDGDYAGKINAEGKLFLIKTAHESVESELQAIAADPMGKLTEHGRITGNCSCCGRELTRKDSIQRGIGPICAERYGLL